MTYSRKSLISLADTPYYHVINRCVRRAFLCGVDNYTGADYSHRRQWMVERIDKIQKVFCINICAYAIMSNHYHLVLFVDADKDLTAKEVALRWSQLFKLPDYMQDWLDDKPLSKSHHLLISAQIKIWRRRLYSISWFMKCLNEYIACKANKEDKTTGRFWQGRFYSQALLDEQALLQCMMYVDLNPIRACIAKTIQASQCTSIYQRINELTNKNRRENRLTLMSFKHSESDVFIEFKLEDYIQLIDWTSRIIVENKQGFVARDVPKLINELGINREKWLQSCSKQSVFYRVLGKANRIIRLAKSLNQRTLYGVRENKDLFG